MFSNIEAVCAAQESMGSPIFPFAWTYQLWGEPVCGCIGTRMKQEFGKSRLWMKRNPWKVKRESRYL